MEVGRGLAGFNVGVLVVSDAVNSSALRKLFDRSNEQNGSIVQYHVSCTESIASAETVLSRRRDSEFDIIVLANAPGLESFEKLSSLCEKAGPSTSVLVVGRAPNGSRGVPKDRRYVPSRCIWLARGGHALALRSSSNCSLGLRLRAKFIDRVPTLDDGYVEVVAGARALRVRVAPTPVFS